MKNFLLSIFISLFIVSITGCSSTQSTMYKPSDGDSGWNINVTKKASITDEFICTINDSVVVSSSFPFIGDNFEKTGTYRGKKVKMNGFKNSTTTTDSEGKTLTTDKYQIRVFIDDSLVDKFDF